MGTCGLPNWIEEQVTDNNYSDTEKKHLEKSASAGNGSEALPACDEHKEGSSCMSQESLIATGSIRRTVWCVQGGVAASVVGAVGSWITVEKQNRNVCKLGRAV